MVGLVLPGSSALVVDTTASRDGPPEPPTRARQRRDETMTISEQNKLGRRINPDHVDDLRKFLNGYYATSKWEIFTHDHDTCSHLVASPRLDTIAHAFECGRESMDK